MAKKKSKKSKKAGKAKKKPKKAKKKGQKKAKKKSSKAAKGAKAKTPATKKSVAKEPASKKSPDVKGPAAPAAAILPTPPPASAAASTAAPGAGPPRPAALAQVAAAAAAAPAPEGGPFQALAVDIGASNGRAVLGTLSREGKLETREVRRFPNGAEEVAGSLRWDFGRLASEVRGAIDDCFAAGDGPSSVGIDTWGVDYALIGDDGELVDRPYGYRDRRTDGMMEKFFEEVMPAERVYAVTGIQFMQINTLFQLYVDSIADPERLRRAAKVLMIPDALAYTLTGRPRAEYTIATTSQMIDARSRTWSDELISALGLARGLFPEIAEPGTRAGGYTPAGAGASALDVVLAAGHDTAAAVAAVPATGAEPWAYVSSGTWTLVGVETRRAIVTDVAREAGVTNEGGVAGTYRLLTNVMGLWLLQECMRTWEEAGTPQEIETVCAEAADAARGGALIDPDTQRFRSPDDMTVEITEYCRSTGQTPPEDVGPVARCIFESLALKTRAVVERIASLTGEDPAIVHMVGGGSRNEVLCQMTADACGRPVVAGPAEGTAAGNLLMQAVAAGRLGSLADIREVVRESFELKRYEPSDEGYWRERYERFRGLLQ